MLCSFWSKYNVKKEYNEATSKSVNFIIVRIIVIFKHIKERIHYISMQHFQLIFPQRALILISADKPAKHFSFLYFSALFFFLYSFFLVKFPEKSVLFIFALPHKQVSQNGLKRVNSTGLRDDWGPEMAGMAVIEGIPWVYYVYESNKSKIPFALLVNSEWK